MKYKCFTANFCKNGTLPCTYKLATVAIVLLLFCQISLCALGRWLTNFSWEPVLNLPTAKDKTEALYNTLIKAINTLMPTQKVKVCSLDKPWGSSRMEALVYRRQWAFKTHGKDSAVFKVYRKRNLSHYRTVSICIKIAGFSHVFV